MVLFRVLLEPLETLVVYCSAWLFVSVALIITKLYGLSVFVVWFQILQLYGFQLDQLEGNKLRFKDEH